MDKDKLIQLLGELDGDKIEIIHNSETGLYISEIKQVYYPPGGDEAGSTYGNIEIHLEQ